mgnify:CR=1 FL=1
MHVGVALKPAGGYLVTAGGHQSGAQNLSLGATGDDEMNFVRGENLFQPQGDRLNRHRIGVTAKDLGILFSGGGLKRHNPASAAGGGRRLIEADMAIAAETQQLKTNPSGMPEGSCIAPRLIRRVLCRSTGQLQL